MRIFRVGTRNSLLARWQTSHVEQSLRNAGMDAIIETVPFVTRGDMDQSDRLVGRLDKGWFTEELENALRNGEIDWAVHSLKDLPTRDPDGLVVGAVLQRASVADRLIVRREAVQMRNGFPLVPGARVGSSALRREALLRQHAPDATALPLRGNVPTRIERLREGKYEAILLAAAGLDRLELDVREFARFDLDPRRWTPAPGQGAVAVQCRADDPEVCGLLTLVHHEPTARATSWERAFLRVIEGGCNTPFGCHAIGDQAFIGLVEGDQFVRRRVTLPGGPPDDAFIREALRSEPISGDPNVPIYRPL
jgi:hydroxymethylbilane synthase